MTAVESNPESLAHYADLKCEVIRESVETWIAAQHPRKFNALLLFDLLEHLRNPVATLSQLSANHLEPGAIVIATFPNVESWSRRLLGRLWFQYKVEHLFYFSRSSVCELGRRAGLQTVTLRPLRKKFPISYFLAVGSHFGPRPFQRIARLVRLLTPQAVARLSIPLSLGEWLWVARKTS